MINKKALKAKVVLFHGDLHSFSEYKLPYHSIQSFAIGALSQEKNFDYPNINKVNITRKLEVKVEKVTIL